MVAIGLGQRSDARLWVVDDTYDRCYIMVETLNIYACRGSDKLDGGRLGCHGVSRQPVLPRPF
jgi:hypothetical protein